jgi:hypothetical protein
MPVLKRKSGLEGVGSAQKRAPFVKAAGLSALVFMGFYPACKGIESLARIGTVCIKSDPSPRGLSVGDRLTTVFSTKPGVVVTEVTKIGKTYITVKQYDAVGWSRTVELNEGHPDKRLIEEKCGGN